MTPHPLESNIWAMHRDFGRIPGASVHDDPDLLWYELPGSNSWLNGASRCDLGENGDEVIDRAVAAWERLGVAAVWHQTPSSQPAGLPDLLRRHGFEPRLRPGMAVELDRPYESQPSGLVIKTVRDRDGLLEWTNTFDIAFEIEPRGIKHPWLAAFAALYVAESSPGVLLVGHVSGVPVATALAFSGGGAVGLYGIGTVPDRRGRGYGAALTLAAMEWGRARGERLAVLQATSAGFPVYERLGFRTVFETTSWIRLIQPPT